jgi:hypothetical protein
VEAWTTQASRETPAAGDAELAFRELIDAGRGHVTMLVLP